MSNTFKSTLLIACYFFISICFLLENAVAQDTPAIRSRWQYVVEPYMMFPNMKGNIGLGNLPQAAVDADVGDIFDRLQFGSMLYLEAHNDIWAITSDLLYMHLKQDISPGKLIASGVADAKQLGWEIAGLRKILRWLEAGAGLRLNNLKASLDLNIKTLTPGSTENKSHSLSKTWVDPIIITRIAVPVANKLFIRFRGDIGGFGIGSKFAWQLQPDAAYQFSKLFSMSVGYRVIDVDYESGSGQELFVYDIDTFGPVIKFGFRF